MNSSKINKHDVDSTIITIDNEDYIQLKEDISSKAEKNYVIAIFEQIKALIETGQAGDAVAVLDQAILDLTTLA